MKSHISHLVFGINPDNAAFYKDLMTFLGWHVLYEAPGMLGVADGGKTSIWFGARTKDVPNDYDGPGLNHLGEQRLRGCRAGGCCVIGKMRHWGLRGHGRQSISALPLPTPSATGVRGPSPPQKPCASCACRQLP